MMVYMLLNEIEERVYIGQTTTTMKDRMDLHRSKIADGSQAPVHEAMRKWPEEWAWTYVILQNCYSEEELNRSEEYWINYTCSAELGVGYNVQRVCHGHNNTTKGTHKNMSEEEREKYRAWGRKGAEKSKQNKFEREFAKSKVRVS